MVQKELQKTILLTALAAASAGLFTAAQAQKATIDAVGCGTGCVLKIQQLGSVSRTNYGYPKVPVSITTVLQPEFGKSPLGYDKNGHPIVKSRGETYPKTAKYWIIADCSGKRVGLYAKDSNGADAFWIPAFVDGSPNNCESACARSFDQWSRLCRAAGMQ